MALLREIISTLSGVSGLNVISRTSVMGYKGTTKRVKEIGGELEAGSVLEGSFRKAGNKIRVTAQLINVKDDRHVWTHSYDRNLDDVFGIQTDIAKQVSDALRVKILAPEIDRIERKPTESTKAYNLYMRGRYHLNRRTVEEINKAAEYFAEAVKEDAKFALGHGGLGDCYELLATNWGVDIEANHERAKMEVAIALQLDHNLAEAHATLGLILMDDYDFKGAEREFKKAIELKPSYATAHHWYFRVLRIESRWDEALQQIERAVELDPFSQIINLNHAEYYDAKRDYAKALELSKKTVELDPNFFTAHFQLATIYARMKKLEDARREAKIGADLVNVVFPNMLERFEAFLAFSRDDKEGVRRLLPIVETSFQDPMGAKAAEIGGYYIYLGDVDTGFEWLEKSYSKKEPALLDITSDPTFDDVRNDPRYQNLLKRLGLEQRSAIPAM